MIKGSSLGALRQKPAQSGHFVVYRHRGAYEIFVASENDRSGEASFRYRVGFL